MLSRQMTLPNSNNVGTTVTTSGGSGGVVYVMNNASWNVGWATNSTTGVIIVGPTSLDALQQAFLQLRGYILANKALSELVIKSIRSNLRCDNCKTDVSDMNSLRVVPHLSPKVKKLTLICESCHILNTEILGVDYDKLLIQRVHKEAVIYVPYTS